MRLSGRSIVKKAFEEPLWMLDGKWKSNCKGVELKVIQMKEFGESEIEMMKRTLWNFWCIGRWMSWIDCGEELNTIVDVMKLDLKELDESVLEAGREIWCIWVSFVKLNVLLHICWKMKHYLWVNWESVLCFDWRSSFWVENLRCFEWMIEISNLDFLMMNRWWSRGRCCMNDGVNVIIWSELIMIKGNFEFQDKIELIEMKVICNWSLMVLIGKNFCEERI